VEDTLRLMHQEIEYCTRRLEVERRRHFSLDEALKRARNELEKKRLTRPQVRPHKAPRQKKDPAQGTKSLEKQDIEEPKSLKSLEGSLAVAIIKLNTLIGRNAALKKSIDQMRWQRTTYGEVNEILQKKIRQTSQTLQKHVNAFDEDRAEAVDAKGKVVEMKKGREHERGEFTGTVAQLSAALRQHERIKKEMEIRTHALHKVEDSRQYMIADEEKNFSERAMRERILNLAFRNCIKRRQIKMHNKDIEVFSQAFKMIEVSTGITDIGEMVRAFRTCEERNFSLLTYINELTRETATIDTEMKNSKNQIEQAEADRQAQSVEQKQSFMQTEKNCDRVDQETKEKNDDADEINKIIKRVTPNIRHMVAMMSSEFDEIPELISEDEDEVSKLLALFEQTLDFFKEWREGRENRVGVTISVPADKDKQNRDKHLTLRMILDHLPSCNVEDDDDEEEHGNAIRGGENSNANALLSSGTTNLSEVVVPLTRQELRQRVDKNLNFRKTKRAKETESNMHHIPSCSRVTTIGAIGWNPGFQSTQQTIDFSSSMDHKNLPSPHPH